MHGQHGAEQLTKGWSGEVVDGVAPGIAVHLKLLPVVHRTPRLTLALIIRPPQLLCQVGSGQEPALRLLAALALGVLQPELGSADATRQEGTVLDGGGRLEPEVAQVNTVCEAALVGNGDPAWAQ